MKKELCVKGLNVSPRGEEDQADLNNMEENDWRKKARSWKAVMGAGLSGI